MTNVDHVLVPNGPGTVSYDNEAVESVKLEKNTKGYNWSVRVVAKPGEDWEATIARLNYVNRLLQREYGNG